MGLQYTRRDTWEQRGREQRAHTDHPGKGANESRRPQSTDILYDITGALAQTSPSSVGREVPERKMVLLSHECWQPQWVDRWQKTDTQPHSHTQTHRQYALQSGQTHKTDEKKRRQAERRKNNQSYTQKEPGYGTSGQPGRPIPGHCHRPTHTARTASPGLCVRAEQHM